MKQADTVKDGDEVNAPAMVEARKRAVRDFNRLCPADQARADFGRMVARHHAALTRQTRKPDRSPR